MKTMQITRTAINISLFYSNKQQKQGNYFLADLLGSSNTEFWKMLETKKASFEEYINQPVTLTLD